MKPFTIGIVLVAMAWAVASGRAAESRPLVVVVMDPLSAKLSCDCVKGYAQRKYERLAAHLEKTLGRKIEMVWAESLVKATSEANGHAADLVIGKHSVVLTDARQEKWSLEPIASLTGKDGKTTQTGLIVVRKDDPATSVADLQGYRIIFGPADCDEKSAAAMALLREQGVKLASPPETADTCSIAATCLVELAAGEKGAAVISSYAEPLLAGCGTIKQGDLRILGVTAEIPFITAFANATLTSAERAAVRKALLSVAAHADLLTALETKSGFVAYESQPDVAELKKK